MGKICPQTLDQVLVSLKLEHEFVHHTADGDVGAIYVVCQDLLRRFHAYDLPLLPVLRPQPDASQDTPSILDAPMSCETPVMLPTLVSQHVCDVGCIHGHTLLTGNGPKDPT